MYWTALILGITGSIHCIGMCSPLAMAVSNLTRQAWLNRFLYNTGRITTYGLLGLMVSATNTILPFSKYQSIVSITLGIVFLVMGVAGIGGVKIPVLHRIMSSFTGYLKTIFATYLKQRTHAAVVVMGMINGFLPCGLTFMVLLVCLTLKSPWEGFGYMVSFGVGTLPAMLGLTALINPVLKKFQWSLRHVTTVLLLLSGFLLIGRALTDHHHNHDTASKTAEEIVVCR